jgi:hypothetical protein
MELLILNKDNVYKPTASLQIDGLNINKTDLGLLNFDIEETKV